MPNYTQKHLGSNSHSGVKNNYCKIRLEFALRTLRVFEPVCYQNKCYHYAMKEIIAGIAVTLTFIAYIPYYRDILQGKTRPHIYSWSLWSLLTVLIVILQIKGGAGPATWVTAAAGLMCSGVVALSIRNGKRDITRSDTAVAILSLLAIVFWLAAKQLVVSITLTIIADMLAFIPTVRKSYYFPYTETLSLYFTNTLRFCLTLFAVGQYTYLSSAWIVAWIVANGALSILIFARRTQVKNT